MNASVAEKFAYMAGRLADKEERSSNKVENSSVSNLGFFCHYIELMLLFELMPL